jgi:probable addiction module antidote protein
MKERRTKMESMFTDEQLERAGFARWDAAEVIDTAEDARLYLASFLEDGGEAEFFDAFSDVARSNAMDEISESMGVSKENLCNSLAGGGASAFQTVADILKALGFVISVNLADVGKKKSVA